MHSEATKIQQAISEAQSIVVIQADNPDADSLGSSLALEQILSEMGKQVHLYCGVEMPQYLQHLAGYDRVTKDIPKQFDLSIIVDTSAQSLLQKLADSGQQGWIAAKPCVILDHHNDTENDISYASIVLIDASVSSTGELIYNLSHELDWPLDVTSGEYIASAILGDTQGLTNNLARAQTYRIMAELIELGVSRPKLEDLRREYSKMDPAIFKYKAELILRTDFDHDNEIAYVAIPQSEINEYSPLYNPAPLIQTDMLNTKGVGVALVFKYYNDGRILCSIRCNSGYGIAGDLAKSFGGGGHTYAAGFKIMGGRPMNEVKSECLQTASALLDKLNSLKD
jgi:phosphoesterase RecJ-like protein